MRKIVYVLVVGVAAASLAGCAAKSSTPNELVTSTAVATETATEIETANEPILDETDVADETVSVEDNLVGGWTNVESPKLTDEVKAYFAEAFPDSADTFYEPEALLGTQVVSGINYKILYRKICINSTDTSDTYAIGTIYVDLQGNVEVLDAGETDIPTHLDEGGWTVYEAADLTDDEKTAFQDAFNEMAGVAYNPITIIAESDTGYLVLCDATVAYPGTEPYYAVVEIKKTETGELLIGEISDLVTEGNENTK